MRRSFLLMILSLLGTSCQAFVAPPALTTHAVSPSTPTTSLNSIKINLRPNESVDSAIMRLRREVNKSGHLRVLRTKRYFEDPREKKKRKIAESRRKMKFARQLKRRNAQQAP